MISTTKQIYNKFNDSLKDNTLICSQKDLDEFTICGLVSKTHNKYIDKNNNTINIEIVKPMSLNINLNNILCECEMLGSKHKENRIYCMSSKTYEYYKNKGYIILKNGIEFFRVFEKELWLVYKIN